MQNDFHKKSTTEEIARRFDADVERFSNLESGQVAIIDAPVLMELLAKAAVAATPAINNVLDIGCGAGNNTIRLLRENKTDFACDLCDLSLPMLRRARERVAAETAKPVRVFHTDFRLMESPDAAYDVILAAAVLHHLRDDDDWRAVFAKIFRLLRPGGSVWISDVVFHENERVHEMMWSRYGRHLEQIGGVEYRGKVFDCIDKEDTPRPLTCQLDLLRASGFAKTEVLHKNCCSAAFGAIKI
jgi:Methylase involved in ubiquinone/menaquinone biosynthesis